MSKDASANFLSLFESYVTAKADDSSAPDAATVESAFNAAVTEIADERINKRSEESAEKLTNRRSSY